MSHPTYKISNEDFLEIFEIVDHPTKTHQMRLVTIGKDHSHYIFLPPVTLREAQTIINILGLKQGRKPPVSPPYPPAGYFQ
jgi:hypothetical protein